MRRRPYPIGSLLGLALLLAAWLAGGAALAAGGSDATQPSDERDRNYFSDRPLQDQDGNTVRFYSDVLRGQLVLVNFIFTHCQDACPLMVRKIQQVRAILGDDLANRVRFVSISIDPGRDTPKELKAFARRYQADLPNWRFLTGTPSDIEHVVGQLGQFTTDVTNHSTLMLAGNLRTHHWQKVPPFLPPPAIAEKLRRLGEEP